MLCISLNNLLYQGELPKPNTNTSAPAGRRGVRRRRDPVGRRARHHPAARAGAPVHAIPHAAERWQAIPLLAGLSRARFCAGVLSHDHSGASALAAALRGRAGAGARPRDVRRGASTGGPSWTPPHPSPSAPDALHGRMSLTSLRRCTRRCPTSWACPRSPTSPSSARASSTTSTRSTVRGPPARLRAFSTPRK